MTDFYDEVYAHPDVQRFNALEHKLHQSTFWKAVHDAKPSDQWRAIRDLPRELWETACYDPEHTLTEEERAAYPGVRAKAYMVRDQVMGFGPVITGKTEEEKLEIIQSMLQVRPQWIQKREKELFEKHAVSLVRSIVRDPNRSQKKVNFEKEEEKFRQTKKMQEFLNGVEKRKARCAILMEHDNDYDLYRSMTSEEISDFM